MSQLAYMFNPTAPLRGPGEARAAAGASSLALLISAAMSAIGAALMSQQVLQLRSAATQEALRFAEESPQTSAILQGMVENGMIEMGVVLIGLWAVVQVILAAWHWRRRGTVLPTIFIVLLVYRLGDRLLELVVQPAGFSTLTAVSLGLLALCVLLHITALRGAMRIARLRRDA